VISQYDSFRLAGFERAVMGSKSFLIGLAIAEGHLNADQAAKAAQVEVQSQIDRWGEVEDSMYPNRQLALMIADRFISARCRFPGYASASWVCSTLDLSVVEGSVMNALAR
jgi:chaperone required for assembly of F1-ATPase